MWLEKPHGNIGVSCASLPLTTKFWKHLVFEIMISCSHHQYFTEFQNRGTTPVWPQLTFPVLFHCDPICYITRLCTSPAQEGAEKALFFWFFLPSYDLQSLSQALLSLKSFLSPPPLHLLCTSSTDLAGFAFVRCISPYDVPPPL